MEPLHCLTPEELLALSTAISASLYRRTDPQDLTTLAGLVTLVGDALTLMASGYTPGAGGSNGSGPSAPGGSRSAPMAGGGA